MSKHGAGLGTDEFSCPKPPGKQLQHILGAWEAGKESSQSQEGLWCDSTCRVMFFCHLLGHSQLLGIRVSQTNKGEGLFFFFFFSIWSELEM